jgi:hypothetical protein
VSQRVNRSFSKYFGYWRKLSVGIEKLRFKVMAQMTAVKQKSVKSKNELSS